MSTYYSFYIGKRNKLTNFVDVFGPYVKKGNELRLHPIFERSGSFIEWDEFDSYLIKPDQLSEEAKEIGLISLDENNIFSVAHWVPYGSLNTEDIVVRGYSPIEDITTLVKNNYDAEFVNWEIAEPLPAEVYAEMSQKDKDMYGHVAFVNPYSAQYIGKVLTEVVDSWDYPMKGDEELGFLVIVG